MWSGKSKCAILSSKVWCRTVSKALLKSRAMTITYGLVSSRCVTLWSSVIIAAVVEPESLKANWSWNTRDVVGFYRKEGHPACKKRVVGCWRGCLSGARCRLAYGPADATATHSLSLASVKSRLVLPFWYRPTRVVLEKGPLNGCVCRFKGLKKLKKSNVFED